MLPLCRNGLNEFKTVLQTSNPVIVVMCRFKLATNGHALAMAGQFITFCPNVCPVNEQKVEIFILLLNSVFSARNCCPITNKKLIKCTSRPAIRQCACYMPFIFLQSLSVISLSSCVSKNIIRIESG